MQKTLQFKPTPATTCRRSRDKLSQIPRNADCQKGAKSNTLVGTSRIPFTARHEL
jgi:hypothetical protein